MWLWYRNVYSPLSLDVIGGRTAGAEDDPYYPNFKTMLKTFPKAGGDKGNGMGAIFRKSECRVTGVIR